MTCSKCGQNEGVHAMGTSCWCDECRNELVEKVQQRPEPMQVGEAGYDNIATRIEGQLADRDDSVGMQVGELRPDWGDGWAELECVTCHYGWVGPIGEVCQTCLNRQERTLTEQRDIVLQPPDRNCL